MPTTPVPSTRVRTGGLPPHVAVAWSPGRTARLAWGGLAFVLLFVTAFGGWVAVATHNASDRVRRSSGLSDAYEQARYALSAEESLERKYRLEPGPEVFANHRLAAADLATALADARYLSGTDDAALVDEILRAHDGYLEATARMFAAVDAGDTALVMNIDKDDTELVFGAIEDKVNQAAVSHGAEAAAGLEALGQTQGLVLTTTPVVFVTGFVLLGVFWRVMRGYQRLEQARHSDERFRHLVQNSSDVILILDADGKIRYASPAAEHGWGYDPAALRDTSALALIHPDDENSARTHLEVVLQQPGATHTTELRLRQADGAWTDVEVIATNLLEEQAVGGLAFTYRDVTERKQAEQQREAFQRSEKLRALGQMASGIAHDLNQSLMLVASYGDLARQALIQDPPNLAELEDLMTTTTQAALDGGETVKRLLLFTRAAPEQDSQPVDLSSVVRDAAQLTAPRWRDAAQAEGRPISLHIEAERHPAIQGSPARLRELMTNLIFNAVDALPTGGTIRLRVVAEDRQGIVEVADSGIGMSAEVQARVFEPFFTTKGEGGSGLGLAMVFGIVEQHGGHIGVRSAPGEGTTFRIAFPLVSAAAEAERSPTPAAELEPLRPLRVLAVDDEPMMTKAVVRMLKPKGHLVSVAGSGEEAIEKLAQQTFDVVVSDMGMGAGINGWELADVVRHRWPGVRFLLATGWGAAMDPSEARTRGVEAVLSKPYHPMELLQALARTDKAA